MERTESSYMDYAEALAQRKMDEANKCEIDSDSDQSDDDTVPRTTNVKSELVGLPKFVVFLSDDTPPLQI
jgi:hypothetical protein